MFFIDFIVFAHTLKFMILMQSPNFQYINQNIIILVNYYIFYRLS